MNKILAAVLVLVCSAVLAVPAGAVSITVQEYTAGKANGDSLAAAADTLSAVPIPSRGLVAMFVGVTADTAAVLYTGQVSLDGGTVWRTVFIDTAAVNNYDEHEIGVPTSAEEYTPGNLGGMVPGKHFRVIADNLGATIQASEIFLKYVKE